MELRHARINVMFYADRHVNTRQNFWMKLNPQKLDGLGYRMVKIA